MNFKLIKLTLPLTVVVVTALFLPAVTQAEESYESGSISAMRAAEQRAALKAKAEKRKAKKAAEAQKQTEAATTPEATTATPEAQLAPEAPKESAPIE